VSQLDENAKVKKIKLDLCIHLPGKFSP